jgi:hypothetical protein
MKRFCLGVAVGLTLPAFALDGTRSPNNAPPVIEVNPSIQNWQLQRAAKELLEQAAQLRRDGAELLAQANPGPTASLRDQFVGAWELVSCNPSNPTTAFACGTNPNGIHFLDASGRYATMIAARGRPKASVLGNREGTSAEDYKAMTKGFVANFGTWSFSEADKTITYHIDGALFPNVEGTEGKAPVSVSGDELKIGGASGQAVWRRIRK